MFGNFARWNEPNTSPPPPSTPSLSMSKKGGIDIGGSSEEKEKMPSGPSNKLHIQVLDSGEYTVSIRSTQCLKITQKSRIPSSKLSFLNHFTSLWDHFQDILGQFKDHFLSILRPFLDHFEPFLAYLTKYKTLALPSKIENETFFDDFYTQCSV